MTRLSPKSVNFKSDLKKLRALLIVLTFIYLGYFVIMMTDGALWTKLDLEYKAPWIIGGLSLTCSGVFIWFNWKRMPLEKQVKINNTFMLIFLGIIGMWLWMPDKNEIDKLSQKPGMHA